jgi:hypothetical protein
MLLMEHGFNDGDIVRYKVCVLRCLRGMSAYDVFLSMVFRVDIKENNLVIIDIINNNSTRYSVGSVISMEANISSMILVENYRPFTIEDCF